MFNFTNDYASLNYISKIKTDSIQKKITYYLNGKIESQVFANSTAYNNAISKIEDTNFILLSDTYYNLKYISIVKQNGKNVTYIFTGKDVVDFAYGTVKAAEDAIALLKDSFLEIEGKWYNAEQLVVANSNEDSLTVIYNFGGEQLNVQYANSTDFEDAVEKVEEVNGGGSGDVDIENNKAATIDVSTYTDPVVVTPSKGKDGMKKATVTLTGIPVLEANKAETIDVSTYTDPVEITPTQGKDGMAKATVTLSNIPSGGGPYYAYYDTDNDTILIIDQTLTVEGGTLTGSYIEYNEYPIKVTEFKNATYTWEESDCDSYKLYIDDIATPFSAFDDGGGVFRSDYQTIYLGHAPSETIDPNA